MFGQLTLRMLVKSLYIYMWKYLVGINDNFAAAFITFINMVIFLI